MFAWSYEEMTGVDPSIVEHAIPTYNNARLVNKILLPVNSRKATAIKVKVEKLFNVDLIYPVPTIELVF